MVQKPINTTKPKKVVARSAASVRPVRAPARSPYLQQAAKLPKKVGGSLGNQVQSIVSPLTNQDAAILGYLTTLSDPFNDNPYDVPCALAPGGVRTNKCLIEREFTIQANASGFGFLTVNMDQWGAEGESANNKIASYNGGTQGYDVWYTDSTYVGTAFPAGSATTATGLIKAALPLVDDSWDATTQMRQVAAGIRGWSDAAESTAQGNVRILSTTEPRTLPAEGAIASSDVATLSQLNPFVMAQTAAPLAGWRSGHVISTFAVPSDSDSFKFHNPPATGAAAFGYPQIGVVIYGAASGQTFTVSVAKVYAFEFQQTHRVDVMPDPNVHVGMDRITNGLSAMWPNVTTQPQPVHSTGIHNGAGPLGFVREMASSRPEKLPALHQMMTRPGSRPQSGDLIDRGLRWLTKKAVDLLPGAVGKVARFFGF